MAHTLRVVLDSNAFSPSHFEALRASPFRQLCAMGRIVPIYPNVMLEEVLRSYSNDSVRLQLVGEWIPTILATAPRLCDDLISIFHKELVQGLGPRASIYLNRHTDLDVREHLHLIPDDGSWTLVGATKGERADAHQKRLRRRAASIAMREEVVRTARVSRLKVVPTQIHTTFPSTQVELVELTARTQLQKLFAPHRWDVLFRSWLQRKTYYPFFNQFVEDVVFQELHFMTNHDAKIDLNAQADLEILAHLHCADAVVTNETNFMRKAFDLIWRPRGKLLFDSEQFRRHLSHVA